MEIFYDAKLVVHHQVTLLFSTSKKPFVKIRGKARCLYLGAIELKSGRVMFCECDGSPAKGFGTLKFTSHGYAAAVWSSKKAKKRRNANHVAVITLVFQESSAMPQLSLQQELLFDTRNDRKKKTRR